MHIKKRFSAFYMLYRDKNGANCAKKQSFSDIFCSDMPQKQLFYDKKAYKNSQNGNFICIDTKTNNIKTYKKAIQ